MWNREILYQSLNPLLVSWHGSKTHATPGASSAFFVMKIANITAKNCNVKLISLKPAYEAAALESPLLGLAHNRKLDALLPWGSVIQGLVPCPMVNTFPIQVANWWSAASTTCMTSKLPLCSPGAGWHQCDLCLHPSVNMSILPMSNLMNSTTLAVSMLIFSVIHLDKRIWIPAQEKEPSSKQTTKEQYMWRKNIASHANQVTEVFLQICMDMR